MFPYHVKLSDGTTTYELAVAYDADTKELAWKEEELPFLLPRQGEGQASYVNRDPETERVEEYRTWHFGFGARRHEQGFYQRANGVDARHAGVLAPAPKFNTNYWYIFANGDAEESNATYNTWNAVNVGDSVARDTAIKNKGSASWRLTTSQSGAAAAAYISLDARTVTAFQGQSVTFTAFIRRKTSGSNNVRLYIEDSVAKTQGSTTTLETFTQSTVTRTIDAGATFVRLGFESNTSATGDHGYIDDMSIIFTTSTVYSATEFADNLYISCGHTVARLNTATRVFEVVLVATQNVTSLAAHNGTLYAAIDGAVYQYSTNGTTWTASTRGGTADDADFFVSVGGTAAKTLWKALKPNTLSSTDDGSNGATAWTDYTVGGSDRDITMLYGYQNSPVVGREDGLWVWDGVNSDFDDITPEFRNDPATTNFAAGLPFNGWLYLSTTHQGVYRYRFDGQGHLIQEISRAFAPSGLSDYGGRLKSFAEGNRWLYCIALTPQSSSGSTTAHVMTLEEAPDGLYVHSLKDVTATNVHFAYVFSNTLYIFVDFYPDAGTGNVVKVAAMDIPTDTQIPFQSNAPSLETSGTIDLGEWDGDFLSETKYMLSWELFGENIDSNNYWTLKWKRTGETSFTALSNSFTTLTSGSQKLTAKNNITAVANRSAKTWQWQLAYVYDGSGAPPLCTGLVVKSLIRYTNTQRAFIFTLDLETPTMLMPDGTFNNIVPRTVYEQLRTWEDTAAPLTLTISDGTTAYDVILRPIHLRTLGLAVDGVGEHMLVDVVAKEVNT